MTTIVLLRRYAARMLRQLAWSGLALLVLVHLGVAYAGLTFWGEAALLDPATFVYYYLTTTTTVGYGDFSPQSVGGRLFAGLWIMVGGIALITAVIGKATNSFIEIWRTRMKGKGDFSGRRGHTVLVGWQGEVSERIVELLLQDQTSNDDDIVICDAVLDENPLPDSAAFISGESLTSAALLRRAGVEGAERVLVHTASDDQTLAVVLTVHSLAPVGHIVAHFDRSETAALARTYAPSLECTSNMAIEMLVRASQDPGLSAVIGELLNVGEGATQYRLQLPGGFAARAGELHERLKREHDATLIGYRAPGAQRVTLNPASDLPVRGGELFYIAERRLADGVLG